MHKDEASPKESDAVDQETAGETEQVDLAPPPARRSRALFIQVLLFFAIIAFAFLTILVKTIPLFPVDLQITRAIQSIHSPFFEGLMRLISWPGFLPQSILITLLIAFTLYVYSLRWESIVSLLAALLSGVTNELVKDFIGRPRPAMDAVNVFEVLTSYSFPSGHVMLYTILFGYTWYLVYTLLKRSVLRSLLLGLFGVLILSVGASRIYLGQHWASDVLGAYLLGGVILAIVILLYQWGKERFFVRQPAQEG
ncbi:MAG TPA: phosphatase PAP2 family protein [Anaerolineales bacterium]|nr:phosphatase PAP2 family protein [Anaerolineales bacterium]